jgi:hypothetical protein
MRLAIALLVAFSSVASAGGITPAVRARTFLEAQLKKLDDKSNVTADALVLGPWGSEESFTKEVNADLSMALVGGSPHNVLKKTTIKSLVAGGNDLVVWFTAEIVATYDGIEPEQRMRRNLKSTSRFTELIALDGETWKVVAGAFTRSIGVVNGGGGEPTEKLANKTQAGTLTALVTSPADLAKAWSTDKSSFVLGTESAERAVGPAAVKKLLGRWTKLGLKQYGDVREVQTKNYAFVQTGVYFAKTDKDKKVTYYEMPVLLIAVPDGQTWKVVAVHYMNRW